jgi:uncharacterized protein (DUF342 family)
MITGLKDDSAKQMNKVKKSIQDLEEKFKNLNEKLCKLVEKFRKNSLKKNPEIL